MRIFSLSVLSALTVLALVGCQTVDSTRSYSGERESKGYLSDSGSKKAAESVGQDFVTESTNTEPDWQLLIGGAELKYDANYKDYPEVLKLNNGMFLEKRAWDDYLHQYTVAVKPAARQTFLEGITRHATGYDRVEQQVIFAPKPTISSPYFMESHIGLAGIITENEASAYLKLHYYGADWIFADKVIVRADDQIIRLNNIDFARDHESGDVWETALLSLSNPEYRNLIETILDSDTAIVRLSGNHSEDIQVTQRMRDDMSKMLLAADAMNGLR